MSDPKKCLLPVVWPLLAVLTALTGCSDDHHDRFRHDRDRPPQRYEGRDDDRYERQRDRDRDERRRHDDRDDRRRRDDDDERRREDGSDRDRRSGIPAQPSTIALAAFVLAEEAPYLVENRGPIHEAFAGPVVFDPTPGLVVSRPPPAPINEIPPDQCPEGDDVSWISGYWGWDDDRSDFIWVSGIWRNMPPDRQFVPGYWREVQGGHQWVSGFWQIRRAETVQYLPSLPESLENGPVGAPPQPDYVWVPGVWVWRQPTYLWRPGHWIAPRYNWVWIPDHYTWTPNGYVFVSGYWDHVVARRGVLFAPIHVPPRVLALRDSVYSPDVVVNVSLLIGDLFARPSYSHFYFGDYYDRACFRSGIYPVFAFHNSRYGYDPIFARHLATQHLAPTEFTQRLRDEYRYRRDHPEARPPRTYAEVQQMTARHDIDFRVRNQLAAIESLSHAVKRSDLPFRFKSVPQDRIKEYRQIIAQTREYKDQRKHWETRKSDATPTGPLPTPTIRTAEPKKEPSRDRIAPKPGREQPAPSLKRQTSTPPAQPAKAEAGQRSPDQPTQVPLKKSPLVSRSRTLLEILKTPPAKPKASAPDPKVKPGTRSVKRHEPQE